MNVAGRVRRRRIASTSRTCPRLRATPRRAIAAPAPFVPPLTSARRISRPNCSSRSRRQNPSTRTSLRSASCRRLRPPSSYPARPLASIDVGLRMARGTPDGVPRARYLLRQRHELAQEGTRLRRVEPVVDVRREALDVASDRDAGLDRRLGRTRTEELRAAGVAAA